MLHATTMLGENWGYQTGDYKYGEKGRKREHYCLHL